MDTAVLEALADPTRQQIVELLRDGEHSVNEVVGAVAIRQSGVSRHLGILHAAGVVQVRRDGTRRLYSLRPGPFRELEAWARSYRALWERRLDRLGEELERRQQRPGGAHERER
jgi:DNA-binding transcriptional ArsR family regulator